MGREAHRHRDERSMKTPPTLEEARAEFEDVNRVNPDCGTVDVDLQYYMALLLRYIDLSKRAQTSARTRKK